MLASDVPPYVQAGEGVYVNYSTGTIHPDGTYIVPIASVMGQAIAPSLQFWIALPSGAEFTLYNNAPFTLTQSQQAVEDDVPASTFTYVNGTLNWNTLPASYVALSASATAGSVGTGFERPVAHQPHLRQMISSPARMTGCDLPETLSTCNAAGFANFGPGCQPQDTGTTIDYVPIAPIDTTGQGGLTMTVPLTANLNLTSFTGSVAINDLAHPG